MKNCKISIVIPTYNRGWCIENAIKSVISQKYQNWELFIVDDGSYDDTKEIIKKYLGDKIKYYYKENSGKLISVNFAINNLVDKNSQIFFILDSDDELLDGILEHISKEYIRNPEYISYHYKAIFPNHIKRYSELIEKDKEFIIVDYNTLLTRKSHKGDFVGFINIKKIGKIRFEESCPNGMENIFWLRILKIGNSKYINIPGIIIDSSRKPGEEKDNLTSYYSIYKRANGMIQGFNVLINENGSEILKLNKNILGKWYFELFNWCIIDRRLSLGFHAWVKSIQYSNTQSKVKLFIFGILFLIPKKFLSVVLKIYYQTK